MAQPQLDYTYPDPLSQVYFCFEAYCVGGCCGYEAYDINAHRLVEWMRVEGGVELLTIALDQLDEITNLVAGHRGAVSDGDLWWRNQSECLEFLDRLRTEMLRMLASAAGTTIFEPSWLLPNARTVEQLARSIVKTQVFGDSPILADALEEAGCTNPDLLQRCRNVRSDAEANWVVNLLVLGADGVFNRPIEPTPDPNSAVHT